MAPSARCTPAPALLWTLPVRLWRTHPRRIRRTPIRVSACGSLPTLVRRPRLSRDLRRRLPLRQECNRRPRQLLSARALVKTQPAARRKASGFMRAQAAAPSKKTLRAPLTGARGISEGRGQRVTTEDPVHPRWGDSRTSKTASRRFCAKLRQAANNPGIGSAKSACEIFALNPEKLVSDSSCVSRIIRLEMPA